MSDVLLTPDQALSAGAARVGGKAIGLARAVKAGARVSPWVVLGVEAFDEHLRRAGVSDLAAEILRGQQGADHLADAAHTVQKSILAEPLDAALEAALAAFVGDGRLLAVRSSATGEDGLSHSYAGVYTSYLYQQGLAQVGDAIRKCWASAFDERALVYRRSAGDTETSLGIGVIVQEMVDGEVSGVLFTRNPITGAEGEALISACWGLCEGVVDGSCSTDEFRLSHTGRELSVTVADKDTMVQRAPDGGTRHVAVSAERRNVRCLTAAQTRELANHGLTLAGVLGAPQDIEWTINGDQTTLLQARPITTLPAVSVGDWQTVWDNSNVQESFNGVTLPLTFSWASAVYRAIFRETLRLVGMGPNKVRGYEPVLRNMVGLVSGRVYYNINNWYRIIALAPSFDTKKEDVEKMIGVQNPVDFIEDQHLTRIEKLRKIRTLIPVAIGWLWRICVRRRSIRIFQQEVNAELRRLRHEGANAADIKELLVLADDLLRLFDRWAVPMFNDFYLSIQAGRVRRMIARSGNSNTDEVVAGLLAAHEAVESIEPALRLMRIARTIQGDERWTATLSTGEPLPALSELCAQAPAVSAELDEFVELFGDRCMGEQKLETISLRQDRSFLAKVLRNYIADPDLNPDAFERAQHQRQERYEAEVLAALPSSHRRRLTRVLAQARDAVRSRESMRLTRTRSIGVGRLLYTRIGERLYSAGSLDDPRQVFYLTMDEISAFAEGRAVTTRLAELARLRAAEFAAYEAEEPPNQFETFGPPYLARPMAPVAPVAGGDDRVLQGVGCCPGVVEGQTQVVLSPLDDLNVRGKILVTVRTDPGWGPLFPGLAGLLVERGSTLSHSAVLARELGIPAVVGVPGLMSTITAGERVRLDGGSGTVWRLDGAPEESAADVEPELPQPADIDAVVRQLVLARLALPDLDVDAPLIDYGLDSVRYAELVSDLETSFGIEIDDDEAANLVTVRDVVGYVWDKQTSGAPDR